MPSIELACPYCNHMSTIDMLFDKAEDDSADIIHIKQMVRQAAGIKDDYTFRGVIKCPECKLNIYTTLQVSAVGE